MDYFCFRLIIDSFQVIKAPKLTVLPPKNNYNSKFERIYQVLYINLYHACYKHNRRFVKLCAHFKRLNHQIDCYAPTNI